MYAAQQVDEGGLGRVERLGQGRDDLAQIIDDERDGVDRALGKRCVPADTLREDADGPFIHRLDGQAVRMGLRLGQLGDGHIEHADRFARNGVGRLGAAPAADRPVRDGGAREGTAEVALLGIADGKLRIRGEQERRVPHGSRDSGGRPVITHLFIAAQKRTEGVARRCTRVDEIGAGIEGEHSRTLIVNDAATEQPSLPGAPCGRSRWPNRGPRARRPRARWSPPGQPVRPGRRPCPHSRHHPPCGSRDARPRRAHGRAPRAPDGRTERLLSAAEASAIEGSDQTGYISDDVLPEISSTRRTRRRRTSLLSISVLRTGP